MSSETTSEAPRPRVTRGASPWATNVLLAVLLLVIVAGGGVALGRSSAHRPGTITVTGSGTVMGAPDTVTVQLGVETTASTATVALNENSARMRALIASLKRNGVTAKNMQTSGLNLYENTNSAGQVTGFTVDNDLTVTIHHLKQAGAAIDAAANAVGNGIQLNGVTLSISNDSKELAAARAKAMRNAKTAASQIAVAGGTQVAGVVKIVDEENSNSYVYPLFATASANADALHAVPIQGGTQAVSVKVKVVFAL